MCSAGLHELIQPQPNPVRLTLTFTPLTGRKIAVPGCTSRNNRNENTVSKGSVHLADYSSHCFLASKHLLITTWDKTPKCCSLTWLLDTNHGIKRQRFRSFDVVGENPSIPAKEQGRKVPKKRCFSVTLTAQSCSYWPRYKPSCLKARSILSSYCLIHL